MAIAKKYTIFLFLFLLLFSWSCKKEETENITAEPEEETVNSCTVTMIKGEVQLTRDGIEELLSIGDNLFEEDSIAVGADSVAELVIGEGSIVRVKENSILKIALLYIHEESEKTNLFLETGKILAHPEEQDEYSSFEVATDTLVCGVRGTEFTMIKDDQVSKVAVTEGEVKVKNNITIAALDDVESMDEDIARTIEEVVNPEIVVLADEKVEMNKADVEEVQQKIEKEVEEIARVLEENIKEEKDPEKIKEIKEKLQVEIKEEKFQEVKEEIKTVLQKEDVTEEELETVFDKKEFEEIEQKAEEIKKEVEEKKEKEKTEEQKEEDSEEKTEKSDTPQSMSSEPTEEKQSEDKKEEEEQLRKYELEIEKTTRLRDQGKMKEALQLAREILKNALKETGENSLTVGLASFNVALSLDPSDPEVEGMYKKAIDIFEEKGPDDEPSICIMYNQYSRYLIQEKNQIDKALDLLSKSIYRAQGKVNKVQSFSNEYKFILAEAFAYQGIGNRLQNKFVMADNLLKKALNRLERDNLDEPQLEFEILENYRLSLESQGKRDERVEIEQKIGALLKKHPDLDPGHDPDGAAEDQLFRKFDELFEEANRFADLGNKSRAISTAEDALDQAKKEAGPDSPITGHAYFTLAMVLERFDTDLDESRAHTNSAITIFRKLNDLNDPTLVHMYNHLGELAIREDNMTEARKNFDSANQEADRRMQRKPQNRREHLRAKAGAVNGLGRVFLFQGKFREAERFLKDSLKMSEDALGRDSPELEPILMDLAELFKQTGRPDEAKRIERRIRDIRR